MNNKEKLVGTINAGNEPVFEIIEDDKENIIIRVIGKPEESISIPKNAIHTLIRILSRINGDGIHDDDIILAIDLIKNAQYRKDLPYDKEEQDSLMRIFLFLKKLEAFY